MRKRKWRLKENIALCLCDRKEDEISVLYFEIELRFGRRGHILYNPVILEQFLDALSDGVLRFVRCSARQMLLICFKFSTANYGLSNDCFLNGDTESKAEDAI